MVFASGVVVVVDVVVVEFVEATGLTVRCTGDATRAVATPIARASMIRLTGFIGGCSGAMF